jgi:hypothetical protein
MLLTAWSQQFVPEPIRDLTFFGMVAATQVHKQQTIQAITMRVSKGVRVLIFGMAVMLGFSASAPKALAQG